jgi:TetR/AcrR family transcriptional regulator, transcriptional repressor for nem operon
MSMTDTTRLSIIKQGARLVHAKGYNNTGLSDILKAAGVPKGSFYHYFRSKDDFGLALIDYFSESIQFMLKGYLDDASTPPLERLGLAMDAYHSIFEKMGHRCGCPIGNLMQEMSDLNEDFRKKVGHVYSLMKDGIEQCLSQAREQGDIPPGFDPGQTAQFILNSWEGAIMHMKLTKSSEPLTIFKHMVFDHILETGKPKRRSRHG